ncbi:MAG: alpha/beta hydrolase [Pseudomonadota bacterium]
MDTILILHGWGSCAKNWQRVKEGLENGGCKVFLPDLPGFGESPPLEKAWSIDDYVVWVKDFVEKNNFDQFFLTGHSFGGSIATKYALKFPKEVKKLILIDPAVVRVKDIRKKIIAKISKFFKIFSCLPFYSLMRRAFYKFIVKSDYLSTEGPMRETRETYLRVIKGDLSNSLSDISVPTVLIWGKKDKFTPLKDAYFIKGKIVEARLEILLNIKHNPQTENPELLVETILKNL